MRKTHGSLTGDGRKGWNERAALAMVDTVCDYRTPFECIFQDEDSDLQQGNELHEDHFKYSTVCKGEEDSIRCLGLCKATSSFPPSTLQ